MVEVVNTDADLSELQPEYKVSFSNIVNDS